MKRYIATIKVEVFAESDERAKEISKNITESLQRKQSPYTELESLQEFRFYGLNNRNIDINPLPYFRFNWRNLFKIFAR